MKPHLDDADLLEILYLDETTEARSEHLGRCSRCHDRFASLRDEIAVERAALAGRVDSKPDSFWSSQREEIVSQATRRNRAAFGFLRLRPALYAIMAILLLAFGMMMIRTAEQNAVAPTPVDTAATVPQSEDLFEDEELRALDPWETDELESFHQIVEWEEWIDDDLAAGTPEEES